LTRGKTPPGSQFGGPPLKWVTIRPKLYPGILCPLKFSQKEPRPIKKVPPKKVKNPLINSEYKAIQKERKSKENI